MSRGWKVGIVGCVFAGMLGVAGFGAYDIYTALDAGGASSGGTRATAAPARNPRPVPQEVARTAGDFLAAWSSGDTAAAAGLTDSVQAATAALDRYRDQAYVTAVRTVPGTVTGTTVTFKVTATMDYQGVTSHWTYHSSLVVGRDANGKPAVQWTPSVLHPKLGDGESLRTGRASVPGLDIVDRRRIPLTSSAFPSLTGILSQLREKYATRATGGSPGIETWVQGDTGTRGETLHTLKPGTNATLQTTLDAGMQRVAERAVGERSGSSVVALRASTGQILAVANNPATGQNLAFGATLAPGSTFKVVTAAALLQRGVRPGDKVSCARQYAAPGGKPYTNVETQSNPEADFRWDFAHSCNTGFVRLSDRIGPDTLPTVARDSFGIGREWNVGVSTWDGKVPGGDGDEMTSEMIGQGRLQMNPLTMASVAATASTGSFHQPTIVSPRLIGEPIAHAAGLSPGVTQSLRSLMHTTAVSGTAATAMSGVGGPKGAKTGSAEAGDVQPNGWFIGYSDDVAAAALVLGGGHGGDSAGPIVASVLRVS